MCHRQVCLLPWLAPFLGCFQESFMGLERQQNSVKSGHSCVEFGQSFFTLLAADSELTKEMPQKDSLLLKITEVMPLSLKMTPQ